MVSWFGNMSDSDESAINHILQIHARKNNISLGNKSRFRVYGNTMERLAEEGKVAKLEFLQELLFSDSGSEIEKHESVLERYHSQLSSIPNHTLYEHFNHMIYREQHIIDRLREIRSYFAENASHYQGLLECARSNWWKQT